MPITKTDVDALTPNSIIWDTGRSSVTGFAARMQRSKRVFLLKYQFEGRARWHSIGQFGSPWTVEQARNEARRVLGELARGEDPAAVRRSKKERVTTVADLCDQYLTALESGAILTRFNRPKRASTVEIDKGRISRHIKPLIGGVGLQKVDQQAVRTMIADITAGKTAADVKTGKRGRAIVTGGPGTAARVADLLSGIMTWAVEQGYRTTNPVHRVRRYRGEPRDRFLSNSELVALGRVLNGGKDAEGERFHPFALSIIRLLVLTGCRLGEIEQLKWSEIDFNSSCLRLADTKTGQSLRAIGSSAVAELRSIGRVAATEFVFPATRGAENYQGTTRQLAKMLTAAGVSGASSHTMRHTFASHASGLGFSDATIAGLLGHKGRGVTSRYVHRPDAALLSAAEMVSNHISTLLAGDF